MEYKAKAIHTKLILQIVKKFQKWKVETMIRLKLKLVKTLMKVQN